MPPFNGRSFTPPLCEMVRLHIAPLRRLDVDHPLHDRKGSAMLDIAMIVLGTGGILLMAAYAALCERI